jgi:hypothetical protein
MNSVNSFSINYALNVKEYKRILLAYAKMIISKALYPGNCDGIFASIFAGKAFTTNNLYIKKVNISKWSLILGTYVIISPKNPHTRGITVALSKDIRANTAILDIIGKINNFSLITYNGRS